LAKVSKQAIEKAIAHKDAAKRLAAYKDAAGVWRIPIETAFVRFPDARPVWENQEAGRLFAEEEIEAPLPPTPAVAVALALAGGPDGGRARRGWHLERCKEYVKELGKRAGWKAYCAAYAKGDIDAPDWVKEGKAPGGWRTLENWERRAGEGGASLADRYAKRESAHFAAAPEQRAFMEAMLLAMPKARTAKVWEALQARFGKEAGPSPSAVRRAVARFRAARADELMMLADPNRYKGARQAALGSASQGVVRLNQRWEVDSTLIDYLCFGETKRRCLLQVRDVYSDRAMWLLADTSNSRAILRLLLRAVREWGLPESVKTDNGKDYTSRLVSEFFRVLGIEPLLCDPYAGEQKPHVERGFRTIQHDLIELLPGYTGHNVAEAAALRARRTFGKAKGTDKALTVEQLEAFIEDWAPKDNHRKRAKTGRLKGKSPAEVVDAWAREHAIRKVPDVDLLGFLLSEPMPKTVQKGGIEHNRRKYIADDLCPGKRVEIRDSPEDAGRIAVFSADGAFLCMAEDAELLGTKRVEIAMRARAKQKAKETAARELARAAKRLVKPGAIAHEILESRQESNVSVLQRPDYTGGTAAMAEVMLAGAADRLAAMAAKDAAGGAQVAAFAPPAPALDEAAMEAASRLFDESGAAEPGAETWDEPPEARFIRILRRGPSLPGDQEFYDYYCQLPEGRGMLLAFALPDAATAAC
jgi:transposase InsO family protein